ncbi:ABC transporter permease [Microbacterium sp. 179-I 3D3 NHS]|uniref:ABC transporter permease n=1 Tax=unclassified Microbacterium TaxID=2609290 RepID=UPI0039A1471F
MRVAQFVGSRLLRLVLVLLAVSLITFTLLQLAPGNFADIQRLTSGATGIGTAGQDAVAVELDARYGEGTPVWMQYLLFMKGVLTWDMGPSYQYPSLTVQEIIAKAFPISFALAVLAVAIALLIAIPVGTLAALRRNSVWDHTVMFIVTLGFSVPNYLVAVFLVLVFSVFFKILPSGGWTGPENAVLPVIALAIGPAAVLARYVRSSVVETLGEEYVLTARAKGGPERIVILRHVLRNSLIPLVTVVGPLLAALMTGTVFVEQIFGIPGLGQYFAGAAANRDMPLLMASALFFALILVLANIAVDLAYGVLDPRSKLAVEARRAR